MALGVPRGEALAGLARRAALPEVAALCAALDRAAATAPRSGRRSAALAADARAERCAGGVGEQAARAAPKIQLVVALLLVPVGAAPGRRAALLRARR